MPMAPAALTVGLFLTNSSALLTAVPATGWYTVAIGYFDYDPRIARFTLEYGRYPSGSINCSQATANQAMAPAQLKPSGVSGFKAKSPATDVSDAAVQDN